MNYRMASLLAVLVASPGIALGMDQSVVSYSVSKREKCSKGVSISKDVRFKFFMDEECRGDDMASVVDHYIMEARFFRSDLENVMQEFKAAGKDKGFILIEENTAFLNVTHMNPLAYLDVSEKNIKQVLALKEARERLCALKPSNGQPVKNMRTLHHNKPGAELTQAGFITRYTIPHLHYKDQTRQDVYVPITEDDIKAIGEALELNRDTVRVLGMFFTPDPETSRQAGHEGTLNYERFVDLDDVQGIYKTLRMYKYLIRGGIAVSMGALLAAIYHFSQK
jgi:hypothetical protein